MKYRRTSMPWLLFFAPMVVTAISALYTYPYRAQATAWTHVLDVTNQVWSGVWIPIAWGLFSGLSIHLESNAGSWKTLRGWRVSPRILFGSKILVLSIQTLLSTLWLLVLLFVLGWILGISPSTPWLALLSAMAANWMAALPLVILPLWLAEMIGWAIAIAFGAGGILIASIIGGTGAGIEVWKFIPWAWPMRIVSIVYELITKASQIQSPNASNTLFETLVFVIGLNLILALSSVAWFNRQESR